MKRLGILGGTFDPIHSAHLVLALEACEQRDLDAVILVPAGDPWQKGATTASAQDRLKLVQDAAAGHDKLLVSSVDVDREGPSYTIDTIRDLQAEYPDAEFEFIIGSDALANLPTWKSYEELAKTLTFVVAERPGTEVTAPPGATVETIDVPLLEISSTDIRARVKQGRSIAFLVPQVVEEYIRGKYNETPRAE